MKLVRYRNKIYKITLTTLRTKRLVSRTGKFRQLIAKEPEMEKVYICQRYPIHDAPIPYVIPSKNCKKVRDKDLRKVIEKHFIDFL